MMDEDDVKSWGPSPLADLPMLAKPKLKLPEGKGSPRPQPTPVKKPRLQQPVLKRR
jgi:hypothetical protein